MYNGKDTREKKEYVRRKRKTQKLLVGMLALFFILTLALGTVSVVFAMRLNVLQKNVAELELQLAEEREKLEEYIMEEIPAGAGGKEDENSSDVPGGDLTPTPSPTLTPVPTPTSTPTSEATSEPIPTEAPSDETTTGGEEVPTEPTTDNEGEQGIWADKQVYLTFDDGPSQYTDDILDILAEYDAKATFFVLGRTDDYSKKMYQRIIDEGHTLAIHSYTHVYKEIYASADAFAADFMKLSDLLYEVTGVRPTISRFPGGSSNQQTKIGIEPFVKYLNKEGIVYFDWNVENGDATGKGYTAEELAKNSLDGIAKFKKSVVLMHDTKKGTAESLHVVLGTLKENGAKMLALDETVTPVQHVKWDSFE